MAMFTRLIPPPYYGRPEEPANLISRLLLHVRGTYVARIRLYLHFIEERT